MHLNKNYFLFFAGADLLKNVCVCGGGGGGEGGWHFSYLSFFKGYHFYI